jgi:ElaB/YqjD/DUF883 family membrane-anchored ribosome-binding protein
MDPTNAKTLDQLAEEAKDIGRDAMQAGKGHAAEAAAVGRSAAQAVRESVHDAQATAGEALDTARGLAADSVSLAGDAFESGRAYAQAALDVAGRTMSEASSRAADRGERYIADEPVRAVLYAAAGGALLTALLLAWMRGRRD